MQVGSRFGQGVASTCRLGANSDKVAWRSGNFFDKLGRHYEKSAVRICPMAAGVRTQQLSPTEAAVPQTTRIVR